MAGLAILKHSYDLSDEVLCERWVARLQHNMWVLASRAAVLSVITGGGKWVEIATHADPLYQRRLESRKANPRR
jgi:hypothetical protein